MAEEEKTECRLASEAAREVLEETCGDLLGFYADLLGFEDVDEVIGSCEGVLEKGPGETRTLMEMQQWQICRASQIAKEHEVSWQEAYEEAGHELNKAKGW